MSYGFLLYNTNGKLIANSNDFNYGLVSEGSLFCNATWTTLSWSDTGEIPLVFIKFDNVSAPVNRFVAVYSITSSSALIGIFDTFPTNGRLSQITGTVNYRIYKTFKSFGDPPGQQWGMKVFNSSGEKTFDSRYKIPLITNVLTLPAVGLPDEFMIPTTVVGIPAGFSNGLWISINSFGGFRGSQFNGTTVAMCLGAVGTGTAGGVPYIIGTFGHQPGGGFSNQNTFDRDKQLFIMPVESPPITYSGAFDGTDDYLTVASNSLLSPGSSDFTIEMDIYGNALASLWDFFHKGRVPTADYEYAFGINFVNTSEGKLSLYIAQDGVNWVSYDAPTSFNVSLNTWYHIAVSKVGTDVVYFVNGQYMGLRSVPLNIPVRGGALGIANNNIGTNPKFNGYISNLRFNVGSAVYTSAFTPPTSPLTASGNTRLLTLNQSTLVDGSSYGFTINNPGGVPMSAFNRFQ